MRLRSVLTAGLILLLGAQDPAPEAAMKAVTPGLVILSAKSEGRELLATGAVIRRGGSRAFVLTTLEFTEQAGKEPIEATVGVTGGAPRRIPAKVVLADGPVGLAIVCVEAGDLQPLKLGSIASATDSGILVGAASATEFGNRPFQLTSRTKREVSPAWGLMGPFEIGRSWDGSVAVNSEGSVVGFFQGGTGARSRWILLSEYLAGYWRGFPFGGQWAEIQVRGGEIRGSFRCTLADPDSKVRSASLVLTRQDLVVRAATQGERGDWSGAAGTPQDVFPLALKEGEAFGEFTVKFALPEDVTFIGQVRMERDTGVAYGPPEVYVAPFSKTKAIAKKDDDWIEGKGMPGKGTGVALGTPIGRRKRTVEDVTITDLDVVALQGLKNRKGCLSEDGSYLFLAGAPNLLRKIRTSDFVEERQLTLPFPADSQFYGLAPTQGGLVLLGGSPVELLVIDEGSLAIRRRVFIYEKRGDPRQKAPSGLKYWNAHDVIAAPASTRVIVPVDLDPGNASGDLGLVVDVGAGRIVRDFLLSECSKKAWETAKKHSEAPPNYYSSLIGSALTPDGRTLLICAQGSLQRFKFTGSEPVLEEVGPVLDSGSANIVVMSPDGLYATQLSIHGHRPPSDHPLLSNVNFIYRVSNLQKPWAALRIPKEGYPQRLHFKVLMAFDREPRQLYVVDNKELTIFDSMGRMTRRLSLFDGNPTPTDVLVHPAGLKLAVLTTASAHWIELPPPK